jgi:hypothetical protein
MAFSGLCMIRSTGLNSGDERVHFDLKAMDGQFDWTPFLAKKEHSRELLAIALAAITANKKVYIQTEVTNPWSEVWWFDLAA